MTDADEAGTSATEGFEDNQNVIHTVHELDFGRSVCAGSAQMDTLSEDVVFSTFGGSSMQLAQLETDSESEITKSLKAANQRDKERQTKRKKCSGRRVGRPSLTVPQEERKRRNDKGIRFSFVEKYYGMKDITLKMVNTYEQAALKGYFQYIEVLKHEHHLKKSLEKLNASEDLEKESLGMRKHKYLDDDGPISPIPETNDNEHEENSDYPEEIGGKIVGNSCFIISSKIPSKKKSKTKVSPTELLDKCE